MTVYYPSFSFAFLLLNPLRIPHGGDSP